MLWLTIHTMLACTEGKTATSEASGNETTTDTSQAADIVLPDTSSLQTLEHDGVERRYGLYFPDNFDANNEYSLIINYHGGDMDPVSQMAAMNMRYLADAHDIILVYPEGTGEAGDEDILIWNSGPYANPEDNKATADDLGFSELLIDTLLEQFPIDPDRVYVTGFSNGGFMTYAVGCYLGDKVAAIAPVAGMMTGEAMDLNSSMPCNPTHPMPVIHFHGTADFQVLPRYGEEAVEFWADYNQTSQEDVTSVQDGNSGATIEHFAYTGGTAGAEVHYYKINNGYHETFSYMDYEGASSLDLIWEFFARYDIDGLR